MRHWRIFFPYLLVAAVVALVAWSNLRSAPAPRVVVLTGPAPAMPDLEDESGRLIDPVCKMHVSANWGLGATVGERTIYFCTQRCRDRFIDDPAAFLGRRCVVCDQPISRADVLTATYLDRTYHLCSEAHRRQFKADPAAHFMHTMWGIPDWLYYLSIALVLAVSFLMFEGLSAIRARAPARSVGDLEREARHGPGAAGAGAIGLPILPAACTAATAPAADRIDLMRLGLVRKLLLSRPLRFFCQLLMALLFVVIIAAGLFGNQNSALNIAPLLTWTIWWCGLVVLIMFAGKAWCYACPWDAIAGWAERFRFWRKTDRGLGLGLAWPSWGRNIWLATILFIGLTWIELGLGVTMRPSATAYLAIAMLLLAVVGAFLFAGKSFCRYGCLIGRVSGLYAMFAGLEVRSRDRRVCTACRTKECVHGSATAYGCPTFENPGRMQVNTYCIQCAECLQACPHDNMAVNLRPWGADLAAPGKPRRDEAYLALLMLAISAFHGLTMTPNWGYLTAAVQSKLHLGPMLAFTGGMAGLMAAPIIIYTVLVWLSYRIVTAGNPAAAATVSWHDYFVRYAYCVLPIALFYHLAHNLEHLLMEGPKILARISDPFGWGWNVFGTAGWHVPPLASLEALWLGQVVLVGIGHVYSLWAAKKISRRLFTDETAASRGQWPLLLGMILFSILSLWLLKQPMEMRTSAM